MKLIFALSILFSSLAYAFPEMTTHGYVNCTACHLSPSGGGILTEYGRSLSREVLSMSGRENEGNFLNGTVNTPKWLLPGGDVRAIQTYLNTPTEEKGEFFLMQAELAAAVKFAKWAIAASVGVKGGPPDVEDRKDIYSRIHYVMYQPTETQSIRVGRFMPQYGLNEPNHTVVTREGLGFSEQSETYNVEAAYLGENWDTFITAIAGRPDDLSLDREKGFALSATHNFLEKNKVGISGYHGRNDANDRWLAGVWGILSLNRKTFLLTEFDHQWDETLGTAGTSTRGMVSYQRLGFEPTQGLQLYATHQLSYLDFDTANSRTDAFGPGVDLFPRPHFEVRAEYLTMRMLAVGPQRFDFAWILGHYYF